jgi:hypothetical protein
MVGALRDCFARKPAGAAHKSALLAQKHVTSVGVMGFGSMQTKTEHPTAP